MAWLSNESHVDVDWQGFLPPHANGNCLLTDIFSRTKIMSLKVFFIDFGRRFWIALIHTFHHFASHILSHAPLKWPPCLCHCSVMLLPAATGSVHFVLNRGASTPGDAKPFPSVQDIAMMPQIYEDVVLRALTWWQNTPRTPCNGLRDVCADPRNISHHPRGKLDGGVRTLILIRSASFPHLFCSRPEVWVLKAWDLQWSSTVCF